jgi:hypothetical protein
MKKVLIICVLAALGLTANAQQNIAKIGVGSLLNRTLNLEYERVLTEKTSALLEVGVSFPADLGAQVLDLTGVDATTNSIVVNSGKFNSFYVVGEYRYYPKGGSGKGFYLAPYLKLANYSIDLEGTYNNNASGFINIPAEINTGMFVAAVGGGIGYQWLIKDRVAINWNFISLGGSFNVLSAEFTADDVNVFEAWKEDIELFLADFPGAYDLIADNTDRTIKGSTGFGFVNARTGVSVGIKF